MHQRFHHYRVEIKVIALYVIVMKKHLLILEEGGTSSEANGGVPLHRVAFSLD